jgi:hypothetical protein
MSPAHGADVSGKVTLTADANDDLGVTGVAFFDDDVKIGDAEPAGGMTWSLRWNANKVSKDAHTIRGIATDGNGQTADHSITLNVGGGGGGGGPGGGGGGPGGGGGDKCFKNKEPRCP